MADRIYPAPQVIDGGSINVSSLRALLAEKGRDPSAKAKLNFALANALLRQKNPDEAITCYEEAIEEDRDNPQLRSNYGLALFEVGRYEEAEHQFRRVLLAEPTLSAPLLSLAELVAKRGDRAEAKRLYGRYLEGAPQDAEALTAIGHLHLTDGDVGAARESFEAAFASSTTNSEVQYQLAILDFKDGLLLFQKGNFEEALTLWGLSSLRFPRAFLHNQTIAGELSALIRKYSSDQDYEKYLDEFQTAYAKAPDDRSVFYPLVLRFLFSVGLQPEAFEPRESLQREYARWEKSLELRGEHPYPHFRFAIIHLYAGEVDDALQELSICSDRLPPKKQLALRIKQLLEFTKSLKEFESRREEFLAGNISMDAWERAGFTDPFLLRAWKESKLAPEEAKAWYEATVPPTQALAWKKSGVLPDAAKKWRDEGFADATEVKQWLRGGFHPEEAARWREACDFPVDAIVRSKKAGFDDPELAARWLGVLTVPLEAMTWHEQGFSPEEAQDWRSEGFTDPHQAANWRQKGHTPQSALRAFNSEEVEPNPEEEG